MIFITTLDGKYTEPLYHIRAFEMEEILNDTFEIAFDSLNIPDNFGHPLIAEEAIVDVNGYKFRIKQVETTRTLKHVIGVSIFYDLVGIRKHDVYGGTHTFAQFAEFIFKGTGWTYEIEGVSGSKLIANFGNDHVPNLLNTLCFVYECEFKILPGKKVLLSKLVGPENDAQYRYGYNVKALKEIIDTTQLATRITGIGADGLRVTVISPNEEKYGFIREAEPYENTEYTVKADLLARTAMELIDYPLVSIELDTLELSEKELGERVWLIYEPLGIKIKTRVLSRKTTFRGGKLVTSSVVLGNARPAAMTDHLIKQSVTIDENNKQNKSRFEQTNAAITLAVERFNGEIQDARAEFQVTAEEIRSEVEALRVETDEGISDSISQISQLAHQITLKADTTTVVKVGERVDAIGGDIEEIGATLGELDENFEELERVVVDVESALSGVGTRVNAVEINMDSMAASIGLKADASLVSTLGTRVSSVELNLDAARGEISQRVSYTDYNGRTIASLINQSASSVKIEAKNIDMTGMVTISSLNSPGAVVINEGNVYGSSYTVGRGTGSTLVMNAVAGSHAIRSNDAAGFRVSSSGSISLASGSGYPITMLGFTRVVGNLSVEQTEGGTALLATNHGSSTVTVNGHLSVSSISVGGRSGLPALFG